jgi:hypothetical protein
MNTKNDNPPSDSSEADKAAGGDCVSRLVVHLRNYLRHLDSHQKKREAAVLLTDAAEEIEILRIALADAIRRPMGVIPASAEGHITDEEIRRAEGSRVKFKPDGERVYSLHNADVDATADGKTPTKKSNV